jgi:hypothetical protein
MRADRTGRKCDNVQNFNGLFFYPICLHFVLFCFLFVLHVVFQHQLWFRVKPQFAGLKIQFKHDQRICMAQICYNNTFCLCLKAGQKIQFKHDTSLFDRNTSYSYVVNESVL